MMVGIMMMMMIVIIIVVMDVTVFAKVSCKMGSLCHVKSRNNKRIDVILRQENGDTVTIDDLPVWQALIHVPLTVLVTFYHAYHLFV